ncbi:MAG: lysophospholipid acyltransferase family protein [Chromatiales bacterium]|jgi:1-acyl-sn-glycerol-3-phosphate acyltransferase
MITIRSLLYFIAMVFTTVFFGLTMAIVGWFLPFMTASRIANAWGRSNLFFLKLFCNLDYRIRGLDNIPQQACIIMSKHQSAWETMALRGLLPANQAWVLKRELMFVPVFGWALAVVNPIAIDRKSGRKAAKQVIEQGVQRLQQNRYVIIFPEGTRVAPGEKKRYGIGGGLLAEKSGVPVVPIALNAGVFWARRGLKKLPGTIDVVIGEPIDSKGKTAAEITREVERWIESEVAQLPSSATESSD